MKVTRLYPEGSRLQRYHPFCHRVHIMALLAAALIVLSIDGLSQQNTPAPEWDQGESGLVDLIAKGDRVWAAWPYTQIVSPPIEISLSNIPEVQRVLGGLVDQIPTWTPYFEPTGRSFRGEYKAFVESLDSSSNALIKDGLQQLTPLPDLTVAFQ